MAEIPNFCTVPHMTMCANENRRIAGDTTALKLSPYRYARDLGQMPTTSKVMWETSKAKKTLTRGRIAMDWATWTRARKASIKSQNPLRRFIAEMRVPNGPRRTITIMSMDPPLEPITSFAHTWPNLFNLHLEAANFHFRNSGPWMPEVEREYTNGDLMRLGANTSPFLLSDLIDVEAFAQDYMLEEDNENDNKDYIFVPECQSKPMRFMGEEDPDDLIVDDFVLMRNIWYGEDVFQVQMPPPPPETRPAKPRIMDVDDKFVLRSQPYTGRVSKVQNPKTSRKERRRDSAMARMMTRFR